MHKLDITLKEVIALVRELPEAYLEETFEKLTEIKNKAEDEREPEEQNCPQ